MANQTNSFLDVLEQAFNDGDLTPNVSLGNHWSTNNTTPKVIANFVGGIDGQMIYVRINDDLTSFATGSGITTLSGVERIAIKGETLVFHSVGGVWIMIAPALQKNRFFISGATYLNFPVRAGGTTSSLFSADDTLAYFPWDCGDGFSMSTIAFEVTIAGAASTICRVGIYKEDPANLGKPGRLLHDFGTVVTDSTGYQTITDTVILPPGIHFIAIVTNGVAVRFRGIAVSTNAPFTGQHGVNPIAFGQVYTRGNGTSGGHDATTALPDPFGTISTIDVNIDPVAFGLTVT